MIFRWVGVGDAGPLWVVVLRSEVDSKASQSGPSEREAEDAPGTPLPGAAPRHKSLAGSHHSPWWGSETSRRRDEKVGRSAGAWLS